MRFPLMKVLATLAALAAVSMLAIGGTYANFSATPVTISSNAFATGELTMARSGSGVVFDLSNAKIGEEATGSVTIENTGTLEGAYSLEGAVAGSLAPSLQLKIYKNTDNAAGSLLYSGTLAGFTSAVDLGRLAAKTGSATYYFHVTLPSTGSDAGDNALQGKSASVSFTWKATQV
jgi:predicted ribosomally synthesized peptide with SipW-like signal peptide